MSGREPKVVWWRTKRVLSAALLQLLVVSTVVRADSVPAIHFDPAEGVPDGGSLTFDDRGFAAPIPYEDEKTYGWGFELTRPATLTHLAVFDEAADGLSTSFDVGLWHQQELTARVLVPEGDDAPLDGLWRLAPLEPTRLEPGHYIIGAAPTTPTDDPLFAWSFYDGDRETNLEAVTVDRRVDVGHSLRYLSTQQGLHRPDIGLLVTGAHVGPNAFFVPVPEPAAWVIFVIGGGPLAIIAARGREAGKAASMSLSG
jgi:hypothetical protein